MRVTVSLKIQKRDVRYFDRTTEKPDPPLTTTTNTKMSCGAPSPGRWDAGNGAERMRRVLELLARAAARCVRARAAGGESGAWVTLYRITGASDAPHLSQHDDRYRVYITIFTRYSKEYHSTTTVDP